jgi:alpha-glucosidase
LITVPWRAEAVASAVDAYEAALPSHGWPNWVLGNHDKPRIATRIGAAQARVAAMLLLTLRGTPTLYYGDELGMEGVAIPSHLAQDPWERRQPGLGLGRDPSRTPMQWDCSLHAGFTKGIPWLPLAPSYHRVNVETERTDSTSLLALYRRLVMLRRAEPALNIGSYQRIPGTDDVMIFVRQAGTSRFLVALNFSSKAAALSWSGTRYRGTIVVSTALDRQGERFEDGITLGADEGIVSVISNEA